MSKRRLDFPPISDVDETRIQAGIDTDPDNPEWTAEDFKRARPFAEVFPEIAEALRRSRGPQKAPTKELVSIRLDRDVVEHFRASGAGWQTRVNDLLRAAMKR
ncbi:BrnA antitoxin family protein [Methylobacterium sp. sgz302541]|uniref:BrnA antitoxin family protein n=1 Tax=unclassified Methylobacterium TaxID=2615210 RepID=UPI003D34A928